MIKKIDIGSTREPSEMKKVLNESVHKFSKKRESFQVFASMEQNHAFKEEYGMTLEFYLVSMLKEQKPIHERRSLL